MGPDIFDNIQIGTLEGSVMIVTPVFLAHSETIGVAWIDAES